MTAALRAEAWLAGLAAAFLGWAAVGAEGAAPAAAWPGPGGPAAEAGEATPGFQVYHFASLVEGLEFREVFLVHDVRGLDVALDEVELRVDGEPLDAAWEDGDGRLSVGDRFAFVQEAFDTKQVLTGHVGGGLVMECRFGGGAGISITPDEWREMGLGHEVRCLQLTDDQ